MNATPTNDLRLPVPTERLNHRVILASAGSGKTHELSGRYLSLLAAGAKPQGILASTFTRLAAGEIRDRLLRRLADSVDDDARRTDLAASLGLKRATREQVMAMLSGLSRNLHLLNVGTLDAFFARVVFAFAIELGLPVGATIVDEPGNQALRLEAIRLMLDEGDPDQMIELLRLLTRGESERNVTGTINRLVMDLYELWRETPAEAWECVAVAGERLSQGDLVAAIDRLAACPLPPNKNFANARQRELRAAMSRDWNEFIRSGLAKKVMDGDYSYYRTAIPQGAIDAYRPLIAHAVAEIVGRLRDQTLATRDMLAKFHVQYEALKRRRRVLTFADLTHAMARAGRDAHSPEGTATLQEIFFRLDAALHHLLLDEFQDTSLAQWKALRPLAREMTDNAPPERTFFCVGDVKQSIYVWRNANPEILERLPSMLRGVEEAALDRSWRSSPVVIDVINDVFGGLKSNDALAQRDADDDSYAEAARLWGERFNRHQVAAKNVNLAGYVQVRFGPARQGSGRGVAAAQKNRRLRAAAELVAELHRANPRMRIALLTRTNDAVARLLYELGSSAMRVPASGRGGGPLVDAPPVNVLLDALHLADHPEDTVAAYNVARSPLGERLGFVEWQRNGRRRAFSRQTRRQLLERGYQATLAPWVQMIAPACDARELRRAAQMVELAGVHDARMAASGGGGLRTGEFIALVELKDIPDSQPAPVEVMTIHQAKGLEFDAVVLAELDMQLTGLDPPIVFERDADTGEIARVSRWIGKEARDFVPDLRPVVRQHRIRAIRESLSLLYVAMTRPRCALYMVMDPPTENEREVPRNFGGVVRAALAPTAAEPESVVFEHGDSEWWRHVEPSHEAGSDVDGVGELAVDRIELAREPGGVVRGEAAASPSAWAERTIARAKAGTLREHLRLRSPEGRERGTVMHALFETIEWLEDFDKDDAALLTVARAACPRRDDRWHGRCVRAFRGMLSKSTIAKALSRGERDSAMTQLLREHPFVRLNERGLVQSGVIDRLVVHRDSDGRPMSATIVDFKTDALDDRLSRAAVQTAAETHRPQLEMYRDAVMEMFDLAKGAVEMQVMFVGPGVVAGL